MVCKLSLRTLRVPEGFERGLGCRFTALRRGLRFLGFGVFGCLKENAARAEKQRAKAQQKKSGLGLQGLKVCPTRVLQG